MATLKTPVGAAAAVVVVDVGLTVDVVLVTTVEEVVSVEVGLTVVVMVATAEVVGAVDVDVWVAAGVVGVKVVVEVVVVGVVVDAPEQDMVSRTPTVSRISRRLAGTSNLLVILIHPSPYRYFLFEEDWCKLLSDDSRFLEMTNLVPGVTAITK